MGEASPASMRVDGFQVFQITLPAQASFPTPATHYLYVAAHEPRIATATSHRSLFIVNVPFDSTFTHIRQLLSSQIALPAGRIEDVVFEGQRQQKVTQKQSLNHGRRNHGKSKKRKREDNEDIVNLDAIPGAELPLLWDREILTNSSNAVVAFVDRTSMEAALKAIKLAGKDKSKPVWGQGLDNRAAALGYRRYLVHHELSFPDKTRLLQPVDTYMTAFAANETVNTKSQAKRRQEPDEEGFVTVTRGGRNNPARQDVAKALAEKQQEKQKGLEDFYRFQSREKRKERAKDLVRKFEDDRKKVQAMREKRRSFVPER